MMNTKYTRLGLPVVLALILALGAAAFLGQGSVQARGPYEVCANGIDDDGDGAIDETTQGGCLLNETSSPTSGDGIIPEEWTDNPTCSDIGLEGFSTKIDQYPDNTTYNLDGTNSVTISGIVGDNDPTFDWSATLGIDAVIVKGGNNSNVYFYDPEDMEDTGLGTVASGPAISHIEFCYDYELTATKTANVEFTRTYTWTIAKSVDPESHTGWFGDEFSSSYDVFVDQTITDSAFKVKGFITINNPTPFTVSFAVSDSVNGTPATVTCPDDDYTLDPGETKVCNYEASLGGAVDGTNTATITSENANVDGTTATAPYAFGDPTKIEGYPEINVTDYFDGGTGEALGSASGDTTFEYDRDFACPTDESLYTDGVYTDSFPNYAEIDETSQQDNANVDLTCYLPAVTKDADTEWFEEYTWTITKSVDPSSHTGFAGDTFTSDYDVMVDQTVTSYGYRAFGSIYVTNPSSEEITVDVADAVNGTSATVDCDGAGSTSLTVGAGATDSCNYTVDLAGTTQLVNTATVSFNGYDFEAYADVIFGDPTIVGYPTVNVTDYFDGGTGEALGSASGDSTFEYDRDFACPTDESQYSDGVYTDSFPNYAEINETGQQDDANVDLTCYIPAEAKVVKTTTEGGEDIGQFPFTFELYDPSDALVETQMLGTGGGAVNFATELKAAGTWTVVEVLPAGWVSTTNLTCEIVIAYPGSAGKTYTCNFDNIEKSRVQVYKTSNGVVDPTKDWQFGLFDGPNSGQGSGFLSSPLATDTTLGDASGILTFGDLDLDPFDTYTICELGSVASAGWTSEWSINGMIIFPYNPHQTDPTPQNLGIHCIDFGAGTDFELTPGEFLTFDVNNSRPGGEPRTPGYWKNWSSCTNGGQYDRATGDNDPDNEFWALDELLNDPGFLVGNLPLGAGDCVEAVRVLDHRDVVSNKKKANDAAFDLARNLFAYYLNQAAGACQSAEADNAAVAGQALLVDLHWDGTGNYLRPKDANYSYALQLSKILDDYNNGNQCP